MNVLNFGGERISNYEKTTTFEERVEESSQIRYKYPDRIPVIVEKLPKSRAVPIDKNRYLVPNDLSMAKFIFVIRKRLNMSSESALYVYVNDTIPQISLPMFDLYERYKKKDGFLYLFYTMENTFG